jgi:hypothetical protein
MSQFVTHRTEHERIPVRLNRRELLILGVSSMLLMFGALLNDGDAGTGNTFIDSIVEPLVSIVTIPVVIILIPAFWMHVVQAARTVVTKTCVRQPGKLALWSYATVALNDDTRVKAIYGWDDPSLTVSSETTSIRLPMNSYDAETRQAIVNLLRYPS